MDCKQIQKIFCDTAYTRTGGSAEERKAAEYLLGEAKRFGLEAYLEAFPVVKAEIHRAALWVDGKKIPCKGYWDASSAEIEAPLYYLRESSKVSLTSCKGKIVLVDRYMGYWLYQDLLEYGAVGFITFDGNANYADRDIDQRELRSYVHQGKRIPGVNINAKDAIMLVQSDAKFAKILLEQDVSEEQSHNVVAELPGEIPEWIVMTAHYDSTSLSQGAYDNMSGSIGLIAAAEYFSQHPHRYGIRLIWCGSEERGLLGSKAYCAAHQDELSQIVLNINLDMIGCIMGKFICCVTAEEKLCHYVEYLGNELGFGISVSQNVYSSDSTPFADNGIPAVSFARIAPNNTATIHNSYDTMAVMKAEQMLQDIDFILAFTQRMACAVLCPVERKMPDNMKQKLDEYLCRKRAAHER